MRKIPPLTRRATNQKIYPMTKFLSPILFAVVCCSPCFAAESRPAITPHEVIALFNGKDLSNFTTWETKHGREDPDQVFSVVDQIDGAPAIRSSGKYFGGIITKESYTNYRLVVECRWGL